MNITSIVHYITKPDFLTAVSSMVIIYLILPDSQSIETSFALFLPVLCYTFFRISGINGGVI